MCDLPSAVLAERPAAAGLRGAVRQSYYSSIYPPTSAILGFVAKCGVEAWLHFAGGRDGAGRIEEQSDATTFRNAFPSRCGDYTFHDTRRGGRRQIETINLKVGFMTCRASDYRSDISKSCRAETLKHAHWPLLGQELQSAGHLAGRTAPWHRAIPR